MPPGSIWMSKAAHSGSAANIVDGRDGDMLAIVEPQKEDAPNGCELRVSHSRPNERSSKTQLHSLFRDEIPTFPRSTASRRKLSLF